MSLHVHIPDVYQHVHLYDDEWEEQKHPRKATGQFAPKGQGEAPLMSTAPSLTAKSKVNKKIEEFYKGKWANQTFPEKPIIKSQSPANAGKQKHIDNLEALALGGEWDKVEAYPVTGTNTYSKMVGRYKAQLLIFYGSAVKSPEETRRKVLQDVSEIVADHLSYDRDKIIISNEDKEFKLNGKDYKYAGGAFLNSGKINIYEKNCPIPAVAGIVAHEIMHQKFQRTLDVLNVEKELIKHNSRVAGNPDLILRPDDTLRPGYKEQYPVYDRINSLMNVRELAKDDGITEYSRDWWTAWENDRAGSLAAIHETLAEMSKLDWEGSLDRLIWYKESTTWKPLYRAIVDLYPYIKERYPMLEEEEK